MKTLDKKTDSTSRAVGRRKSAAARVRLTLGTGVVTINGKTLEAYFPSAISQKKVLSPFVTIGREKNFDASIKVAGGGVLGQAEAARHGIARALLEWDETLRPVLKAEGLLTRDPRAKERKKPGHLKARRGRQWRKR
jgi:small subunit ribosomal protein S9